MRTYVKNHNPDPRILGFKKRCSGVKERLQRLVDRGSNPASATSLVVTLVIIFLSPSFPNDKMRVRGTAQPAGWFSG